MPTLQALMTARVSESEQGQLQGANSSVGSIAGVASPIFFGWVYSMTVVSLPGAAFYFGGAVLLAAAIIGWIVARKAERAEATAEA
jgi:DHA1 family tetracycline resistance protein-like MFS transporter